MDGIVMLLALPPMLTSMMRLLLLLLPTLLLFVVMLLLLMLTLLLLSVALLFAAMLLLCTPFKTLLLYKSTTFRGFIVTPLMTAWARNRVRYQTPTRQHTTLRQRACVCVQARSSLLQATLM